MHNQVRHIATQVAALITYLALAWPYFGFRAEELPWPESFFAIGATAFIIATLAKHPWWWRLIHLTFVPLLWLTSQLGIDPGWFLLAFVALLLVYRGAVQGRIPLYLSSASTILALGNLLAERQAKHFVDLGAGIGTVIAPLAAQTPTCQFTGAENAPASWLLGLLRTRGLRNCGWHWKSLWDTPLVDADVVYAFLSPEPMAHLWEKIKREMRPGTLFVSNSFPVPDVAPAFTIELEDRQESILYCYELT